MSEILKSITGNGLFPVRNLHGKTIEFPFVGPLNIQTNDDFQFDRVDTAIVNRPCIFEYPYSFLFTEEQSGDMDTDVEGIVESDEEDDEGVNSTFERPIDKTLKIMFASEEYRDEYMLLLLDVFRD